MSELSGKRLGDYRILEQIGRGGMAIIYRARHPSQNRFVALKVVAPHLTDDPNFEERFRREAAMLMRLKHPHRALAVRGRWADGGRPQACQRAIPKRSFD